MRNLFMIISVLGISIYTIQAEVGITFTFANGNVSSEGGEYFYDFDVMAAAGETGTRIGTGIVYINYNTNAFGTYIHTNSNVVATKGELIDITYGPFAGYNLIANDNDIGRVAYTFEYLQEPGYGEDLPVTATQLIHLRFKIQDNNQTSDLSFENSYPIVMTGQQYYDDNATQYEPVICTDTLNEFLNNYPPSNLLITITGDNIQLKWDPVPGATEYIIYSSDNPYLGFEQDENGIFTGNIWNCPIIESKKFFKVTSN